MPANTPVNRIARRAAAAAILGAPVLLLVMGAATTPANATSPSASASAPASVPAVPSRTGPASQRPSPPAPAPGKPPAPAPSLTISPSPLPYQPPASGQPGCGFLDFPCQIGQATSSWLAGLVVSGLNSVFSLLGRSLLATAQFDQHPAVRNLWTGSLAIADACYVLLVIAGGLILMGYETVQTSYTVKEIAPRLAAGFVLSNVSLLLIGKAISLANGLSGALVSPGVDPAQAVAMLQKVIRNALGIRDEIFILVIALVAVVLGLLLALTYVVRIMVTILLIGAAPLALACHALPQTEGLARLWWRSMAGVLAIQVAQALVLIAAMRIFFSPGVIDFGPVSGRPALPTDGGPTLSLLIVVCLLYVLMRIPFWISRMIWRGGVRNSPVSRAARFVLAAVVYSRVRTALRGATSRRPPPRGGRRPPGPRPGRPGGPGPAGRPGGPGPRGTGGMAPGPRRWPGGPGGSAGPVPRPYRARHAAPPPLPAGGSQRTPRHAAPPPLPADRPQPRRQPPPQALPSARIQPPAPRHAKPPPLPAGRPRHAKPPPLPASGVQQPRNAQPPPGTPRPRAARPRQPVPPSGPPPPRRPAPPGDQRPEPPGEPPPGTPSGNEE